MQLSALLLFAVSTNYSIRGHRFIFIKVLKLHSFQYPPNMLFIMLAYLMQAY